ncbi:MAG: NAD(P)-binding protein [Gemmatimonadota bacterium]|nr:NAD(P)-binding protein [Gemmatimonadota bacterium]
MRVGRKRVAVIGTGISGLGAAWLLAPAHDVRVFEREDRIGGHTNTRHVRGPGGTVALDSGFIVYNTETYPLLTALFDALDVDSQPVDMSFSFECKRCGVVYSGLGAAGTFADPVNALRPEFLAFLAAIGRFNFKGRGGRLPPTAQTLRAYVASAGSEVLGRHYAFPLASVAHMWGRRRYATNDQSRNNWWVALATLGEGWHNNHHRYPSSERQGFYWWELDVTHYVLKVMERFRLVWDLRVPPATAYPKKSPPSPPPPHLPPSAPGRPGT